MSIKIKERFLRLNQIVGDPNADPPVQPIIPISKSAWYEGVKAGKYPKPYKIGGNTSVYLASDIQALIDQITSQSKSPSLNNAA